MNPLDIIILAVIAAAIVGALVAVKKHKCGTCGKCNGKEENETDMDQKTMSVFLCLH